MSKWMGSFVEDMHCNGIQEGRALSDDERRDIAEWAATFEECSFSQREFAAMDDKDLIGAAYWTMAEYARGQM